MFGKRPNDAIDGQSPGLRPAAIEAHKSAAPAFSPKLVPPAAPAEPVKAKVPPPLPVSGAPGASRPAIDPNLRAALGAPAGAEGDRRNKVNSDVEVTEIVAEHTDNYMEAKDMVAEAMFKTIDVGKIGQLDPMEAAEEIREVIAELVSIKKVSMSVSEQDRLVQDIIHDVLGYGPLEPLLMRDDIADIMVNGWDKVFIEVNGVTELTNVKFRDNAELLNICQRIVSAVGRRVDESSPMCDARLPDGSRVNVILPPLGLNGPTLTIRKFKKDKLTLRRLVDYGSISPAGARVLAVIGRSRCNVLISGGTGSGKTTLLNTLTAFIDVKERIITCEDAAELQLQQPHVVSLETRPANLEGQGLVRMQDLLKNCLRMRPDRIIVGEVRGPEAFDLLQAMNTGHDGSMGTLHANSPREALGRLESMITMGYNLTNRTIREMISGSVDVIIQAARLRDGSRRITHITEVLGMEGDLIILQDLYVFNIEGEDADGKLIGKHSSTGILKPKIWERARYYNLHEDLQNALEPDQWDAA